MHTNAPAVQSVRGILDDGDTNQISAMCYGFTAAPNELAKATHLRLTWLWHGYLAPRKVTTLMSPSKSGETTLYTHLSASFAVTAIFN